MKTPQIPALPGCTPLGLREKPKHSPLPWRVGGSSDTGEQVEVWSTCQDAIIRAFGTGPEDRANIALAVRAVNSHAALVEAFAASEALSERIRKKAGETQGMESRWFWSLYEIIEEANARARAALNLVRGDA